MSTDKSRRRFMRNGALVAGTALVTGSWSNAEAAGDAKTTRLSQPLVDIIRIKHASHDLGPELKAIEEDIGFNLAAADALRRIPLENGDEPDFLFRTEDW